MNNRDRGDFLNGGITTKQEAKCLVAITMMANARSGVMPIPSEVNAAVLQGQGPVGCCHVGTQRARNSLVGITLCDTGRTWSPKF